MEVFHAWERLTISQIGPLNGSNQNKRKPEQYELCLNIDHIIIHVQKYSDKHTYLLKGYLTFSFWVLETGT